MKVNQIVSEHKKGVRAMKYGKKTKGAVPVYGPEAKDAKLKPVKPVGPGTAKTVNEDDTTMAQGKIVANDGKTITVAMPDGTQIQKPVATAIGKDQQGNPVFNVATKQTPATMGQAPKDPAQATATGQQIAVNTGTPVEDIAMGETGEVGGDPTDDFIDDVTEAPVDTREVFYVAQGSDGAPRLKVNDSSNIDALPKVVYLPKLDVPGYDIASKGFRSINIELPGSKQRVNAFMSGQYVYANKESFNKIQQAMQARQPGMPELREADDALLSKMLTIAGLR